MAYVCACVAESVLTAVQVDRCVLYVFRVAVYVASTPEEKRDPNLLKWWNWKGPEDVAP